MLVQVLREVYARWDETRNRLLEECPLRMRGEETGKAERAFIMQCGSDSC